MAMGDDFMNYLGTAFKISAVVTKAIKDKTSVAVNTQKVDVLPSSTSTENSQVDFQKKLNFYKKYGRMPEDGEI